MGEGGEFPPKKGAVVDLPTKRQLDFTGAGSGSGVVLPEHPQPKGGAVATIETTMTTTTATAGLVARPVVIVQNQPQQRKLPAVTPPPPPPPPPPQQQESHASVMVVKPESPKSRPRPNADAKDATPKKQKQCNCKHSRCLKLYCECFASGTYCDGCNCVNCYNNVDNEAARREAVEATLERNPNAFRPKIASSPHGTRDSREEAGEVLILGKHNKGCHCKKSGCLKKYCECFQANILCSDNCKCLDCKNFEGSEERQALFHGDHTNNITYVQQAANAAITGAIGSSGYASSPVSKKRRGQELFFGQPAKDPAVHRLGNFQQANSFTASSPTQASIPIARSNAASAPSKVIYRSLLSDIIQPQDLKELCSVLVFVAAETAKALADQGNAMEKKVEDQNQDSLVSPTKNKEQVSKDSNPEKTAMVSCTAANEADKVGSEDLSSDGMDNPKGRPMSPGTLALMCDEQDTMFMAAASPNRLVGQSCNTSLQLSCGQGMSESYAVHERIVLTQFRDCLNRLITCGEIKETKFSSIARNEIESRRDPRSNGSANGRTMIGTNHQGTISNGVSRTVSKAPTRKVTEVVNTSSTGLPKVPTFHENGVSKSMA